MTDEVAEAFVRQTIEAQQVPFVTLAWQGGEPTLMGLDFFRHALEVERDALPEGWQVERTIQTNGTLLDDEWAAFLAENDILVGLSIDGPRELHDAYRHDGASVARCSTRSRLLRTCCRGTAPSSTCCAPSTLRTRAIRSRSTATSETNSARASCSSSRSSRSRPRLLTVAPGTVTDRSVGSLAYGEFLSAIFDEWVRHDVGEMFVQFFDGVLASYVRGYSSLCVLRPTCGEGVALEHNGDVYSCDHFVDTPYLLGNIMETPIGELVRGEKQVSFGQAKRDTLPSYCLECEFLFACNGECPKNRILLTPDGEQGLNYLCEGLKYFFSHTDRRMKMIAELLQQGRAAGEIMPMLAEETASTGRNEPCPCGSGRKFKACCGR